MPPAPNVPSRLSQPSFERFRQIISNAADLGRTVEVTAAGLASSTLAARLRDALLSYRKFHWGDETANPTWCSLSVYTDAQGKVYIGRVPPADKSIVCADVPSVRIEAVGGKAKWNIAELQALCLLISNHRISGGVTVPLISPQFVSTLELDYDIAITSTTDASIIF